MAAIDARTKGLIDKFMKSEANMTTRFNSIDENLHEIKHLLLQELKGKEVERITPSPSIMQEHPLFSHGMGGVIREKF